MRAILAFVRARRAFRGLFAARRFPMSLNQERRASPAETPLFQRPSRTLRFPEPAISPVTVPVFIRGSKEKAPVETGAFLQLMGLEPTPKYMDMNLNHARMPIPPQLQASPILPSLPRKVKRFSKKTEVKKARVGKGAFAGGYCSSITSSTPVSVAMTDMMRLLISPSLIRCTCTVV